MKYAAQYLLSAVQLIQLYDGAVPLAVFLKNHFSQHKKYGSKDRKFIAQLCYSYFRLGHAGKKFSTDQAIKIAVFCCNDAPEHWASLYEENWLANWSFNLTERISFIQSIFPEFNSQLIFPFNQVLSKDIDATAFSLAQLIQPDLFIRLRPEKTRKIIAELVAAKMIFQQVLPTALALPNGTKLDHLIAMDKEAIVQDLSSQKVGDFFEIINGEWDREQGPITVWDCCAASGGKSILAKDILENIQMTVSDLRPSILHNLNLRFQRSGITQYKTFVIDLSKDASATAIELKNKAFDLVICDAPCSGSGTWSRTPEQLYFFKEEQINTFNQLQQKIVSNIIPTVKKGGYLLYITCSVFEKENEAVTQFIQSNSNVVLIEQKVIKGYADKADTMFAALFKRLA
ncbi:MAG: 16S rRNA (cytosine967-C5)-methyltransferase [Chitinophagaceae bacterium]|nr:MAG: hypothetical protein FD183_875 [Chitinophagaceae bacterium]TXT30047.1 MAG: 16S rRNA (cytosine967-C5)-methyltransferase [Chitinophagaceae bacterium]